ncbi:Holliday junction ATP-dependent DNA helicase RuvA [hydrothermal vent metagenome]|uniref:Holliday junction ATP-dependent DNA helicase RuvA n=1 Tax=hydrothermal vent metagenome TaxID=652676 RepID=A0A3B0Z6Q2_9ZZZZ
MIGRIKGQIIESAPPYLMVDVNGIGYELSAPMPVFYNLPPLGEVVVLYTHLVVREDAHQLYAFSNVSDRQFFRQLIRVSGVGAKLAIAILSAISSTDFAHSIKQGDVSNLVRIPGIGKKTAERLIVEMKDRVDEWAEKNAAAPASNNNERQVNQTGPISDAVSALIALGYKAQDASRMVRKLNTDGLSREEIIRQALQKTA